MRFSKWGRAALIAAFTSFLSLIFAQTSLLVSVMYPGHPLAYSWMLGFTACAVFWVAAIICFGKHIQEDGFPQLWSRGESA